ncbi:amidohydrolase family protein [Roseomonas gilardii]|uniref:amidohydrolase family protein n=1 Tax=Roseomonas gilardii TaxID=257708 RepID=UPI0021B5EBF3|nr:amidohydrolase family protein [Roseomonas gilardii]
MSADYDLVIRCGTLASAAEVFEADIGIKDGIIAALGRNLPRGVEEISAKGMVVTPGGIDSHCHIEELGQDGSVHKESFATGSATALAGGTTSFICFLPQWKGHSLADSAPGYAARAAASRANYSFHQIITDPTPEVLRTELPALVARGIRSFKVFLTYDPLRLTDREFIEVLAAARRLRHRALRELRRHRLAHRGAAARRADRPVAARLVPPAGGGAGGDAPRNRAGGAGGPAHPGLPRLLRGSGGRDRRRPRARGLKVWGETCPQYLTPSHADLQGADFAGAKAVCSPALREAGENARVWKRIQHGTLDVVTSDHCGFSFATQKKVAGSSAYGTGTAASRPDGTPVFNAIPNGVPGIETRMPVLFSEGVSKGRIGLPAFVRLTSANAAKLFGLGDRKGSLMPGTDADLVLWDPDAERTIRNAALHHAIDYTPWEGMAVKGWPNITIRRGAVAARDGEVLAPPGSGRFLPRGPYALARPRGVVPDGFDAASA